MSYKPILRIAQNRTPMAVALMLVTAISTSGLAQAAAPCNGVERELTDASQREYSPLVAKSVTAKVKSSQIKISNLIESGSWSAVYASTPISDDGVFFFQEVNGAKQFKDVWGGWADPSERPELIDWAEKLGAPDDLARCFAQIVTE